jgi:transcriptional regulator with XRE-family HTH domain
MTQGKHGADAARKPAATNTRSFRTFLLVETLAAQQIGARIAHARRVRGLSQDELAEMTSFSKRSLQDYEAGVTIPYKHFREIGRLLNQPEEWFLYGDDDASAGPRQLLQQVASGVAVLMESREDVLRLLQETLAALERIEGNARRDEAGGSGRRRRTR